MKALWLEIHPAAVDEGEQQIIREHAPIAQSDYFALQVIGILKSMFQAVFP